MKLVLFDEGRPGLLREDGVVDISDVVSRFLRPSLRFLSGHSGTVLLLKATFETTWKLSARLRPIKPKFENMKL